MIFHSIYFIFIMSFLRGWTIHSFHISLLLCLHRSSQTLSVHRALIVIFTCCLLSKLAVCAAFNRSQVWSLCFPWKFKIWVCCGEQFHAVGEPWSKNKNKILNLWWVIQSATDTFGGGGTLWKVFKMTLGTSWLYMKLERTNYRKQPYLGQYTHYKNICEPDIQHAKSSHQQV